MPWTYNVAASAKNASQAADRANAASDSVDQKMTELEGLSVVQYNDRLVGIENNLSEQAQQTAILQQGLNVITSDQASPLNVEVQGNTLVNMLGKDGSGTTKTKTVTLDSTKYYLFVKYDANKKRTYHEKFTGLTTKTLDWTDGSFSSLFELISDLYNKIGVSLLDADVERLFPYVESIQHVKNPVVKVSGANLLPPFNEWTLHANAKVISPYELELNATTNFQYSTLFVNCVPNTVYSINVDSTGVVSVRAEHSPTGVTLLTGIGQFTSPSSGKITIRLDNSTTGTFSFKNPILNIGSTAKPFTPKNDSYLYAETTLAGLNDKKDRLAYNHDNRSWEKTKWFEHVVLGGELGWVFDTNNQTQQNKVLRIVKFQDAKLPIDGVVSKYNGVLLKSTIGALVGAGADLYRQYTTDGFFYISVANADSGWTDSMIPTANMIKGLANGWKYTGNGTTHSWASVLDGITAPVQQTEAFVASNKVSSDWKGYWQLTYQLAIPVTEPVTVEGDLAISGNAQVEVGSGVIVREKVTPQLFAGSYYLNHKSYSPNALLKNSVKVIQNVYKNSFLDKKWTILTGTPTNYNGLQSATIPQADFDPTAEYTVTYEILDKYAFTINANDVKATYQSSLKSSVSRTVEKVSDLSTQQSINVRAIAELYKRVRTLEGV